jgi:soluble P-type ATPase
MKCIVCGGDAEIVFSEDGLHFAKCIVHGHEFPVLVNYIDHDVALAVKVFRASIDVSGFSGQDKEKLKLKIKRAFSGRSNFNREDVFSQLSRGVDILDLGYYDAHEVPEIEKISSSLGFSVGFIEEGPSSSRR